MYIIIIAVVAAVVIFLVLLFLALKHELTHPPPYEEYDDPAELELGAVDYFKKKE